MNNFSGNNFLRREQSKSKKDRGPLRILPCIAHRFLIFGSILIITISSISCKGKFFKETTDNGTGSTPRNFTLSAQTDSSSRARVSFQLPPSTTKFAATAESAGLGLAFENIRRNDGTEFLNVGEIISLAVIPAQDINSATVPVRDFDPAVNGGETFSTEVLALVGLFSPAGEGRGINFTIQTKADNDLNNGILNVNVFFVGAAAQTSTVKNTVNQALDIMRNIYRSEAGIEVGTLSRFDVSGSSLLPDPIIPSDLYRNASLMAPSPALNLFIGEDINVSDGPLLGVSPSIPGPAIPTGISAVAISLSSHTGADGQFSGDELELLGETLAHEGGHYMGLFHPVDFNNGTASDFDSLPDTPTCPSLQECRTNSSLIQNLMFATPVFGSDGRFIVQNQLTGQQRGVLNRYIAVD